MSDPTLFEENQEPATQPQDQNQENAGEGQGEGSAPPAEPEGTESSKTGWENLLSDIKNDKGEPKYGDVDTALGALKHSQEYIPQLQQQLEQLKQENEQLKTQSQERESVEDIVNRLASKEQEPETGQQPAQQGFGEEDIQRLVSQHLEQRELAQRTEANQRKVSDSLRERYGEKAPEILEGKANELGLSRADLGEWAKKSPDAVLALFGSQQTSSNKPHTSSHNIPPTNPKPETQMPRRDKSMLIGASSKEQTEYMRQIKQAIHAKYGVEE